MTISFHGAAQTVTGSKHLLSLDSGKKVLLDCGMFQGMGKETILLNQHFGFDAKEIHAVVMSHAHIDHSGLLPKLYKDGFRGPIYCTPPTADLIEALLMDSARIQEADIKFVNKRKASQGLPLIEPLYTQADAEATIQLLQGVEMNTTCKVTDDCWFHYTEAGHILGSAAVNLTCVTKQGEKKILFSGDIGRFTDDILKMPESTPQADFVIIESTYGDSLHQEHTNSQDILLHQIHHTCVEKKGVLIIPAFSVGRTQELLFALNAISLEGKLPKGVPIFVDSPLSIRITEILKKYPVYYNDHAKLLAKKDNDVFDFEGLKFISTKAESMQLNTSEKPCVIISASGMAEAGRVKHHIAHKVGNPKNTILFSGYCSPHGLGGRLQAGDKEVKIFAEMYAVGAEIAVMRSMSAHGDYEDLLQYLSCQNSTAVEKVFVVHGEKEVQQSFIEKLNNAGFKHAIAPAMHEVFIVK
jgi:metallo-beta-lactamase family protein